MSGAVVRYPWRQWLLLALTTVGLAGLLGMVQVVVSHFDWRLDLTPEKRYTLSEHAQRVLASLDHDVQVVAFLRADDERNADIEDLLVRVHKATPRVRYTIVDANRNPAVAREYGVESYGSLVVESEGRRKEFGNPREDLLMEAILQVTRPMRKVVYFLAGHGEQNLDDSDHQHGYSNAGAALRTEFYEVHGLDLSEGGGVPDDANALVIAGPRHDLLPGELQAIGAYVDRGGALLIMLDPQTAPSLVAFLRGYGVQVGDDVIVDPENRMFAGDYFTMTVPGRSERHPVSAELKTPPLFSQARSVRFVGAPRPGVKGIEFLTTASSGWSTPELAVLRAGSAEFVADRDQRGPIPVGVSLLVEGQTPPPRVARFIILGDSDFASNFFIEYLSDKDLLVNAVNWLVGQENLLGQRPQRQVPGVNQFFVSARQGRLAFLLGTIVEPAAFLFVGALVFVRRRWRG